MGFLSNTLTLPEGIHLYFTDSGPPPSSTDYTTAIFIHGSNFNGRSFEGLHSHAHSYNLRSVIVTRREYKGSTPLFDSDLDDLQHGRKAFLDRMGAQLGHFIKQFIQMETIPKISQDRRTGGVAVVAWSFGALYALSLFSVPGLVDQSFLKEYIKDFVLYDPTHATLGYPAPDYSFAFNPVSNAALAAQVAALSPDESRKFLCTWIASYYSHPKLSVDSDSLEDFDTRPGTDRITTDSWTPEQIEEYYETFAIRSEHFIFTPQMQNILHHLSTSILFSEELAQTCFPEVRIAHLGCTQSNWGTVWCTLETKRRYNKAIAEGKKIRKINFVTLQDCNHFAHYDRPTQFLSELARSLTV